MTGIREYFGRNGMSKAVLGLVATIAVVATLAVQALGPNVLGVAMSSQYSSPHSLEDAECSLAIWAFGSKRVHKVSLFDCFVSSLRRGTLAPFALENLQATSRMILMTFQITMSLVLTTGNKSELAMDIVRNTGTWSERLPRSASL